MNSPLANVDSDALKKLWLEVAKSSNLNDSMYENEDFEKECVSHGKVMISETIEPKLLRIVNAWREMGLPAHFRSERFSEIVNEIDKLVTTMTVCEEESLKKMHELCEIKQREIQVLISELGEQQYVAPSNMTLMASARDFYLKCEDLKILKETRVNEWLSLKNVKAQLHLILGIGDGDTHDIHYAVPHPQDLLKLREYVNALEERKSKKFETFITLRKSVVSLFDQLEREPADEFENELVNGDVSKFILSTERLNLVTQLFHSLQEEAELNTIKRKQLMEKISSLWEILEVSSTDKSAFKACNSGTKPSILKRIEKEIEKLEVIKRENMGLFIERMRTEIVKFWNKCFVGQKHRDFFNVYFDDNDYNDELLEIHERELEKYRQYYDEVGDIFAGIEKYNSVWERLLELEKKATDPARLKNRGGNLLKESNERAKLQKDIPKLESAMLAQMRSWSEKNGNEKIFINDIRLESYFENKWSDFKQAKEMEKQCRQIQKKLELQAEMKGVKLAQRNGGGIVLRKTPVQKFHAANSGASSMSSHKRPPLSPVNRQNSKPKKCTRNLEPLMGHGGSKTKSTKSAKPLKKNDTYSLEDYQENENFVTMRRIRGAENKFGYGKLDKRKSRSYNNVHDFANMVNSPVKAYINNHSSPC